MNNKYVSITLMTPLVLIDSVKMLANGHLALFLGFIKFQFPFFSNIHGRQLLNTTFILISVKDRFRNLHQLLDYSTMPTGDERSPTAITGKENFMITAEI